VYIGQTNLVRPLDQYVSGDRLTAVKAEPAKEFEFIRKDKIGQEVARRIEKLIAEELKPGDKVPPERQLAEMFNVSRSSIRDGIHTLEIAGLLERRQGAGTVVREVSISTVANPLSSVLVGKRQLVSELLDVRKMLEPGLAARAAANATVDDLGEMEEILRRQREKVARGEPTIDEDSEFHYAIALAANNSVILKVLDVLMDLLRDTRERSLQVEGRLQKSFAGHRQILSALKRRDPEAAEKAMRRHLQDIEEIVLQKF
jgi:GntR family transcriptional regulator, transcriptional repressor for pyruvate dehydrogenase complex